VTTGDPLLPTRAVLSHASAARTWRLPLPHNLEDTVHVTVPRSCSRWRPTTAVVHRRTLRPYDITVVDGTPVTTRLRTLVDLSRAWRMADAVAAADHALHHGTVSREALETRARATRGPGSFEVRCLAALCDASAESPPESVLRVTLQISGVAAPECQLVVRTPIGDLRVDFAWPCHRLIVEVDGFAYHSGRAAYRNDRERNNALQLLGWRLLRFTWEQIMGRPDWVVAQIAAALAG
jgi:very-short-patch-repair endonuclease